MLTKLIDPDRRTASFTFTISLPFRSAATITGAPTARPRSRPRSSSPSGLAARGSCCASCSRARPPSDAAGRASHFAWLLAAPSKRSTLGGESMLGAASPRNTRRTEHGPASTWQPPGGRPLFLGWVRARLHHDLHAAVVGAALRALVVRDGTREAQALRADALGGNAARHQVRAHGLRAPRR
jgi:hypothetical protein